MLHSYFYYFKPSSIPAPPPPSGESGDCGDALLSNQIAIIEQITILSDRVSELTEVRDMVRLLFKRQGLFSGVTATVKSAEAGQPGELVTSDGSINQVLVQNDDGSVTISNA